MSPKQRLTQAIAELPESLTIEEAVERLYLAFKLKQAHGRDRPVEKDAPGATRDLAAILDIARHCSSLPDIDLRCPEEIVGYDERGKF